MKLLSLFAVMLMLCVSKSFSQNAPELISTDLIVDFQLGDLKNTLKKAGCKENFDELRGAIFATLTTAKINVFLLDTSVAVDSLNISATEIREKIAEKKDVIFLSGEIFLSRGGSLLSMKLPRYNEKQYVFAVNGLGTFVVKDKNGKMMNFIFRKNACFKISEKSNSETITMSLCPFFL